MVSTHCSKWYLRDINDYIPWHNVHSYKRQEIKKLNCLTLTRWRSDVPDREHLAQHREWKCSNAKRHLQVSVAQTKAKQALKKVEIGTLFNMGTSENRMSYSYVSTEYNQIPARGNILTVLSSASDRCARGLGGIFNLDIKFARQTSSSLHGLWWYLSVCPSYCCNIL